MRTQARFGSQSRRRGFTLIEVMMALVITVVGLLSAFSLVGIGTAVNTDSRSTAQAYQAAQQELEILRALPFSDLQALNSATPINFLDAAGNAAPTVFNTTGYPGGFSTLASIGGTGKIIVQNDTATNGHLCKHVTVTVTWTEGNNTARTVNVGTLITQGGINPL